MKIPTITTTSGPFMIRNTLYFLVRIASHNIKIAIDIDAIRKAPGAIESIALKISEKVFSPSN